MPRRSPPTGRRAARRWRRRSAPPRGTGPAVSRSRAAWWFRWTPWNPGPPHRGCGRPPRSSWNRDEQPAEQRVGNGKREEQRVDAVEHAAVTRDEVRAVLHACLALEHGLDQVPDLSRDADQHAEENHVLRMHAELCPWAKRVPLVAHRDDDREHEPADR